MQVHERATRVSCVVKSDMTDIGRLEHAGPPGCESVWAQCLAEFVDDDEAAPPMLSPSARRLAAGRTVARQAIPVP
jgi:hypothetical protein